MSVDVPPRIVAATWRLLMPSRILHSTTVKQFNSFPYCSSFSNVHFGLAVAQTGGENQRCQPKMTQHEAQDLIGCLVLVDSVNCVADDISAITKVNLVGGA